MAIYVDQQAIMTAYATSLTMLVNSGASEQCAHRELLPRLQDQMMESAALQKPHQIITAGKHVRKGIASGTVTDTVRGANDEKYTVSFAAIVMPGS